MTKAKAIKQKCLDCTGSPKEVTLCHIVECPLWLNRFGYSLNDMRFKQRTRSAKKNYPKEFPEVQKLVLEQLENMPNSREYEQIRTLYAG